MPPTELLAETWHPHRWVVDAMLLAAVEAEKERDAFKAGNTELLELLMKLHAGQHESILPRVREILAGAGLVDADNALNWAALEARKPKQQTWAEAVSECVTDPEARNCRNAMNPEQNGYQTEGDKFMTLPENLRRCLWMLAHERMRQDEKWGGPEHDDLHTTADFAQLAQDYAGWARVMSGMGSADKAQRRMLQVAALALADVERAMRFFDAIRLAQDKSSQAA